MFFKACWPLLLFPISRIDTFPHTGISPSSIVSIGGDTVWILVVGLSSPSLYKLKSSRGYALELVPQHPPITQALSFTISEAVCKNIRWHHSRSCPGLLLFKVLHSASQWLAVYCAICCKIGEHLFWSHSTVNPSVHLTWDLFQKATHGRHISCQKFSSRYQSSSLQNTGDLFVFSFCCGNRVAGPIL